MKILEKPVLPKEVFAVEVVPQLLAQSVRIYLANQRQGTQSAKTRAEINRTRKKLYKQKGTGGARHGDRKAPIFIGGGVSFAPKPRDYSLKFPKVMKDRAMFGALSLAVKEKKLQVVSGLDKLTGKTKELADFLKDYKKCLIITDGYQEHVWRAGRNIENLVVLPFNQVNTYEILKAKTIFLMDTAVDSLTPKKTSVKKELAVKKVSKKKV